MHGGRLMQAIARTRAIRGLIREPLAPDLLPRWAMRNCIADFRARAATVYHPVGTCRMGSGPRRLGGRCLRCACTESNACGWWMHRCFPTVTSANTNAPTLMVAQKAADLILAGMNRKRTWERS